MTDYLLVGERQQQMFPIRIFVTDNLTAAAYTVGWHLTDTCWEDASDTIRLFEMPRDDLFPSLHAESVQRGRDQCRAEQEEIRRECEQEEFDRKYARLTSLLDTDPALLERLKKELLG